MDTDSQLLPLLFSVYGLFSYFPMIEIRLRSLTGLLKFGSKNEESPLSTAMVWSFPILHRIVPACHRRELPMEYAVFYHPFLV